MLLFYGYFTMDELLLENRFLFSNFISLLLLVFKLLFLDSSAAPDIGVNLLDWSVMAHGVCNYN